MAPIHDVTSLPNGDVVVGGEFTLMGEVNALGVARWNGDTWSAFGSGLYPVYALTVLTNGDLVAGGGFSAPNHIARWNGFAWVGLGTGIGSSGSTVDALVVLPNGDLVAGGAFATAGGSPAANLALWNGTSWSSLGGGTNGPVKELRVLANGDLVVGGDFTLAGTTPANDIARWNGTAWTAFGVGVSGTPSSVSAVLELPNGDVIVGGQFTAAGGVAAINVARWDGALWNAMGAGLPAFGLGGVVSFVAALAVDAFGDIIAGGRFGSGLSIWNISRWDGAAWTFMNGPVTDQGAGTLLASVNALHRTSQGTLFVCGYFLVLDGSGRFHNCLALWGCPAIVAASTPFGTGCGVTFTWPALSHAAQARPILGTTVTLSTTAVPSGSLLGGTILGWLRHDPGISLAAIGMPGCFLYCPADVGWFFVPSGNQGQHSLAIPNSQAFLGVHVFSQGFALVSGINALGVISSNGVDLRCGYR